MVQDRKSFAAWLQAAPMMLIFGLFFLLPLVFVTIVSAWDYNEYEMLPAFSLRGYTDTFEGCIADLSLHHPENLSEDPEIMSSDTNGPNC